jgi:hypothetical protein
MSAHDLTTYVEMIKDRLTAYFDFETVPELLKDKAQVFARFTQTDEKYFLSRRMNLYTVNNHQYVAVGEFDHVTDQTLKTVFASMTALIDSFGSFENTMSTDYTFTMVSREPVDADAIARTLQTLKYHKSFSFGWHGWADLGLIVVDLSNQRVYGNRYAQQQLETVLWSFDGKPLITPKRSLLSRLPLIRGGGCCS